MLQNQGKLVEADARYREALAICRAASVRDYRQEADILNFLGFLCAVGDKLEEARQLYKEALSVCEQVDDNHLARAETLKNIGDALSGLGHWTEAVASHSEALAIRIQCDASPYDIAQSTSDLSVAHGGAGDLAAAEELSRRSLLLFRESQGEGHPDYAIVLFNLGSILVKTGRSMEGVALLEEALEAGRKSLPPDDPQLISFTLSLAKAYASVGKSNAARHLFEQLSAKLRRGEASLRPRVVADLLDAASFFQEFGSYAEAEGIYLFVARFFQARTDPLSTSAYLRSQADLAALYLRLGRTLQSKEVSVQALEMLTSSGGQNSLEFASVLNNMAEAFRAEARYDRAIEYYTMSLGIRLKTLGNNHPQVATVLNNIGLAYLGAGQHFQSESMLLRALQIDKDAKGNHSPEYAIDLHNLGQLYAATGREEDAVQMLQESLRILSSALGDSNPTVSEWSYDLASLHIAGGRLGPAIALLEAALLIDDRLLGQAFSVSSEHERMKYLRRVERSYQLYLALACFGPEEIRPSTTVVFEAVMRRKGLLFESSFVLRDYAEPGNRPDFQTSIQSWLGDKYPGIRERYERLVLLNSQIARSVLEGHGRDGSEAHFARLLEWARAKEELETQLARSVPGMDFSATFRQIKVGDLAARLPSDAVLIEVVRIRTELLTAQRGHDAARLPSERYVAFLLKPSEQVALELFDLGEAGALDRLIRNFLNCVSARPALEPLEVTAAGEAVRDAAFDAVAQKLLGSTDIFLAPDGEFCLLPFESLPGPSGGHLIDSYRFNYLSCGRDLLRFGRVPSRVCGPAVVAADPAFNLSSPTTHPSEEDVQSRRSGDLDRGMRFRPLKNTRQEGKSVASMLGVEPWLGPDVVEGRLKKVESPWILHIATHGFFLGNQPERKGAASAQGELVLDDGDRLSGLGMENPMLRSGLALAGANVWLAGGVVPVEAEDGLLTAEDVSSLRLSATELVVLSACETGLGDVRAGEGVFGLRRAFGLAGARSLVMSLWKVPDAETKELMLEFYRLLLAGAGVAAALRRAQLAMKAIHPAAYYWGAFICQGEPGPLRSAEAFGAQGLRQTDQSSVVGSQL